MDGFMVFLNEIRGGEVNSDNNPYEASRGILRIAIRNSLHGRIYD